MVEVPKSVAKRLVTRPEEMSPYLEDRLTRYHNIVSGPLQDYLKTYDQQCLFGLDGYLSPVQLTKQLVSMMRVYLVSPANVVQRLQDAQDEEEDVVDDNFLNNTEDLMRSLGPQHMVAPRFRWRRSRWLRYCPVELYDGNMVLGSAQFAVSFLDKMYCLSSSDALDKFMKNPRPYLLPPQPRPPCKFAVQGPPLSGKTTLCYILADHYNAEVLNVKEVIHPRLVAEKKKLIEMVKEKATAKAIEKVTQNIIHNVQAASTASSNPGDDPSSDDHLGLRPERSRDEQDTSLHVELSPSQVASTQSQLDTVFQMESAQPQVDATNPEEAVQKAKEKEITLPATVIVKIVQDTIVSLESRRHAGRADTPKHGGWILDDFPLRTDVWSTLLQSSLVMDSVILLLDSSPGGVFLAERYYKLNSTSINTTRRVRLKKELEDRLRQEEEELRKQKEAEDEERAALEAARLEAMTFEDNHEESLQLAVEDKSKILRWPEMAPYLETRVMYEKEASNLQTTIFDNDNLLIIDLEVEGKTKEQMAEEAAIQLEKPFTYQGWEYSLFDMDEEDEDLEAEMALREEEAEDEMEEEEDEDEEVEEDPNRGPKKALGETSYFCPVALKDKHVLIPGNADWAACFRERIYYMSSTQARDTFLLDPIPYLPGDKPLTPPPIRLLILGTRGSGKTTYGAHLAYKLGLFHIAFRERLQELILPKTKKLVVPVIDEYKEEDEDEVEEEEEEEEEEKEKEKEEDKDTDEEEKESVPDLNEVEEDQDLELTEDEEAIKQSIIYSDYLSYEILDNIVPQWWTKEPFCRAGFVLEGFPRTADEVRYLAEKELFSDAVLLLTMTEEDMQGRLLPPRQEKWRRKQEKRQAKKKAKKEKARKKREAEIQKRREELLKERAAGKATEQAADKDEDSEEEEDAEDEEEEEEEDDDIEDILAEEFEMMQTQEEEEAEEEEEETEEEALNRMVTDLTVDYNDFEGHVDTVMAALDERQFFKVEIDAGRKPHIVRYLINKNLKPYIDFRRSIFERVCPIQEKVAQRMLTIGYKQLSRFGRYCPVKLSEGDQLAPFYGPPLNQKPYFCLYRQHVFLLSSSAARDAFSKDPLQYLQKKPSPGPRVPIRIAILGPPKAGKSTLARRFAEDYGLVRLSVGEAMRTVLNTQVRSHLGQRMRQVLCGGHVVPEELQVEALERVLLDAQCQTNGYVLDGYPMTVRQARLLEEAKIMPYLVIHLEMDDTEVLSRGLLDRTSPARLLPLHDSEPILQWRTDTFRTHVDPVLELYSEQHRNVVRVEPTRSKWWVWNRSHEITQSYMIQRQKYLSSWIKGKAASVADLGVTPQQYRENLGEVGQYCPVALASGQLVDGSTTPDMTYVAKFKGCYYKMAGPRELQSFLDDPERYLPPQAPCTLPPLERLPKKRILQDLQQFRPVQLQGYCPVTYLDGKRRYEALVPGNPDLIVEYLEKFYYLESEEKVLKFMRTPEKYSGLELPRKLPPATVEVPVEGLSMLGFLEQGVSSALVAALTATGNFKPKYPFQGLTHSALLHMAYHLKAFNPKSSTFLRKKYKQKLEKFEDTCNLIRYLGDTMPAQYPEPHNDSHAEMVTKLDMFMALKDIEPTTNWIV
ncbi:hypothetical protein ACOMHN_025500 [Nucella lapillus]